MTTENLAELLARLTRTREEADREYNDALTALDRAIQRMPEMPHPPPPFDERQVTTINEAWNILPSGPPPIRPGLKGRLASFVWRMVGPSLQQQLVFNAAQVEHLNRNVVASREAAKAITSTIAVLRGELAALVGFQSHLIQFLQQITPYVDTRDREVAGRIHVVDQAISAVADELRMRLESLSTREWRSEADVARLAKAQDDLRTAIAVAHQAALMAKREVERLLETPPVAVAAMPAGAVPVAPDSAPVTGRLPASDLDSYKYVGFEDQFRGSREQIRERLARYLSYFDGASDVLDLGCGRGEFLDLLRERGIRARGLDINHEMVEVCRARGLDVTEGDALTYLRGLPDQSLGGLLAAQVVEHLEPAYLMRLLETACHKLGPGTKIVLETINPACWVAFFESYIRDLTHERPLHPETLKYLLLASGFAQVDLEFLMPVPEEDRLQRIPAPQGSDGPLGRTLSELVEAFNANAEKLNSRLYTHLDYAAIGTK